MLPVPERPPRPDCRWWLCTVTPALEDRATLECHGPGTRPAHSARQRGLDQTAKLPDFWTLLSRGGGGTF